MKIGKSSFQSTYRVAQYLVVCKLFYTMTRRRAKKLMAAIKKTLAEAPPCVIRAQKDDFAISAMQLG